MTIDEWLSQREQIIAQRKEWDAGIAQIRLSDGSRMYLDDAVPDTRGDCPTQKPCPHVRCRYHLWRVDGGEDGTRAGRPGLSAVPRNKQGLTLRVLGDVDGSRPGTTLEPRWLESPVPPSCALDCVDAQGKHSNDQIGKAINRHRTLAAREVDDAALHGERRAQEMFGMTREEFVQGLRELGGVGK